MQIRNARIVPGSHPKRVKRKTRQTDPHPLSITASGGNRRQSRYRTMSMTRSFPVILTLESSISLSDLFLFICKTDEESDDCSRQPSDASEEEGQQNDPAPLVEHGKRREDEAQYNADDEVHKRLSPLFSFSYICSWRFLKTLFLVRACFLQSFCKKN